MVISQLEIADINNPLSPKSMQIDLTGFLEDKAMVFMTELWNLLLVSQKSEGGIAPDFIQAKKAELLKRKEEIEKKKAMMEKLHNAIKQGKPEDTNQAQKPEEEKPPKVYKEIPKKVKSRDRDDDRGRRYHHSHRKHHSRRYSDSSEDHYKRRSRHNHRHNKSRSRSRSESGERYKRNKNEEENRIKNKKNKEEIGRASCRERVSQHG